MSSICARPVTVTQLYVDPISEARSPFIAHLLAELSFQQLLWPFHVFEATGILEKPFDGVQQCEYAVRPVAPRYQPTDQLVIEFRFHVRSGVTVEVTNIGDGALVTVTLDGGAYRLPDLKHHTITVTQEDLEKAGYGYILPLVEGVEAGVLGNYAGAGAIGTANGVNMEIYDPLTFDLSRVALDNTIVSDDTLPFPVIGWVRTRWHRSKPLPRLRHPLTWSEARYVFGRT